MKGQEEDVKGRGERGEGDAGGGGGGGEGKRGVGLQSNANDRLQGTQTEREAGNYETHRALYRAT